MSDLSSDCLTSGDEVESLERTDDERSGEESGGEGGEGGEDADEPKQKRKKPAEESDVGPVREWISGPEREEEAGNVFGYVNGERLILGTRRREAGEELLATLPWNPDLPMKTCNRAQTTKARFLARQLINDKALELAAASGNTRDTVCAAQDAAVDAYAPVLRRAQEEDKRKKEVKKQQKKGKAPAAGRAKAGRAGEGEGQEELCSLPWSKNSKKERFVDAPQRPAGLRPGFARNIPPEDQKNPLKVFLRLFPKEIMFKLIERTNRKGKENIKGWKDVDEAEMIVYLSLHMSFWVSRLPKLRMHWSDSLFASPIVARSMSKNRFFEIHSNFTIADRLEDLKVEDLRDSRSRKGPDGRPAQTPKDKGFKMAKALALFSDSWIRHYTPSQHISIDEASVSFTGRFRFKLSIKAKPVKSHVRLWALACSRLNYQMHMLLSTDVESLPMGRELGMASASVLALIDDTSFAYDLSNKGITLYCDNFYSSPQLMECLRERGLYFMGSLRSGTGDLPSEVSRLLLKGSALSKMARGTTMTWATPASELFIVMDSAPVGFLTNMPHLTAADETVVLRRTKGNKDAVPVNVPVPLSCYNSKMGGVDVGDRLVANVRQKERNVSWTAAVLNRLMRVSVANSFLIWRDAMGLDKKDTSVGQFTLQLCESLLKFGPTPVLTANVLPVAKALEKAAYGIKYGLMHEPVKIKTTRLCAARINHSGKPCHKQTLYVCGECRTKRGCPRPLCHFPLRIGEKAKGHFRSVHKKALQDAGRKLTVGDDEGAGPSHAGVGGEDVGAGPSHSGVGGEDGGAGPSHSGVGGEDGGAGPSGQGGQAGAESSDDDWEAE